MLGWRAYYRDGHKFSSAVIAWASLPAEGLVGVVVFERQGYRSIIDGYDWIWLQDGKFYTVPTHKEWGKWAPRPQVDCASCVKQGAGMEDAAWAEIKAEMVADRVF